MLESLMELLFVLELALRFLTCPDFLAFARSPFVVIDLVSVLPLLLRAAVGFVLPSEVGDADFSKFALVCWVPVLRMMKLLRRSRVQIYLFETVVNSTIETLQFLTMIAVLLVLAYSSLFYIVEPRETVDTYFTAVWLTVVTMATVGYGDVTAVTVEGRIVTISLIICSVLFMALPIGVLGNAFSSVWKDRDLILLIKQTRSNLSRWGFTAKDVPAIFKRFSGDGEGELTVADFTVMLKEFRVNLNDERIIELFSIFDGDNGGTIDDREFLRMVFPQTWHQLVKEEKEEEERQKAILVEKERVRKERSEKRKRRSSVKRDSLPSQALGSMRAVSLSPRNVSPRARSNQIGRAHV